jgi:hypothetical protein
MLEYYNHPLLIAKTVVIIDDITTTLTTALDSIINLLRLERFIRLIAFRQLFKLHER